MRESRCSITDCNRLGVARLQAIRWLPAYAGMTLFLLFKEYRVADIAKNAKLLKVFLIHS